MPDRHVAECRVRDAWRVRASSWQLACILLYDKYMCIFFYTCIDFTSLFFIFSQFYPCGDFPMSRSFYVLSLNIVVKVAHRISICGLRNCLTWQGTERSRAMWRKTHYKRAITVVQWWRSLTREPSSAGAVRVQWGIVHQSNAEL